MKKHLNYPKFFEIQTASYCNGGCIICPYREVPRTMPSGFMDQRLFKRIVEQIGQKSCLGIKIIPYLNNEPFLDKFFINRVEYINQRCPAAEVEISTNLSLFDDKKQKELSRCLMKELRLSVFGFTKKSYERVMTGLKWENTKKNLDLLCVNKKLRSLIGQISLVMIDYPGIRAKDVDLAKRYCRDNFIKFKFWGFLDRGGNVSSYSNKIKKNHVHGCGQNRVSDRMHILFDGRVVICCMDWRQKYILGDLSKQTIDEVWESEKFNNLRKMVGGEKERSPAICKKCKLSL